MTIKTMHRVIADILISKSGNLAFAGSCSIQFVRYLTYGVIVFQRYTL